MGASAAVVFSISMFSRVLNLNLNLDLNLNLSVVCFERGGELGGEFRISA